MRLILLAKGVRPILIGVENLIGTELKEEHYRLSIETIYI